MPETAFFRSVEVQAMLLNVLFVYCKINADLGYRQGMHELLAPILWVVHHDAASVQGSSSAQQDKVLIEILDPQYVEHDAFSLLCIVMQTAKSFYETTSGTQQSPGSRGDSPIVERSKRIHEEFLSKADPELASHLTAIDILPQIFVIRWIRLLFGREFPFDSVLALWDMIFAEDPSLTLVDHICLAMLLRVRWQLLRADYSSALTLLLRYPEPKSASDIPALVGDAVYLSKHMDLQGGSTIIRKYSGKSPLAALAQSGGEPVKRKGAHTPHSSVDINRTMSPLRSSADYIQSHGGIEAILQGAAKNVYSRSEQWGLNKAIRGAVQNLQNNTLTPPHQRTALSRWSLDEGKAVRSDLASDTQSLKAMEERNQVLSTMLAEAVGELNDQAKSLENEGAESAATALTLTTAKLHYVQVYLQDTQLPLEPQAGKRPNTNEAARHSGSPTRRDPIRNPPQSQTHYTKAAGIEPGNLPLTTKSTSAFEAHISPTDQHQKDLLSLPSPPLAPTGATAGTGSPRVRPSIANSSYSWMLGEDKPKAEFVTPVPFAQTQKRESLDRQRSAARTKSSFLFGEDGGSDSKASSAHQKNEKEEGNDGFTSPTLKGGAQAPTLPSAGDGFGPL